MSGPNILTPQRELSNEMCSSAECAPRTFCGHSRMSEKHHPQIDRYQWRECVLDQLALGMRTRMGGVQSWAINARAGLCAMLPAIQRKILRERFGCWCWVVPRRYIQLEQQ